jgi:hypothetical protein
VGEGARDLELVSEPFVVRPLGLQPRDGVKVGVLHGVVREHGVEQRGGRLAQRGLRDAVFSLELGRGGCAEQLELAVDERAL